MSRFFVVVFAVAFLFSGSALADEVEDRCMEQFGEESSLTVRCINDQQAAKARLVNFSGPIRRLCDDRWGRDYVELLSCLETQAEAQDFIENLPPSAALTACHATAIGDYDAIAYCVDRNWLEIVQTPEYRRLRAEKLGRATVNDALPP